MKNIDVRELAAEKPEAEALDSVPESPRGRAAGLWRVVFDALQEDIIFGRLQPEQHLVEDEVIARLDASRHAVRRAFEELEQIGLAVRLPNRGARVRSYRPGEVQDLYEVREALERTAALRIPLPASPELIDKLEEIASRHEKACAQRNILANFRANNEFHETLFGACGNVALADAIRRYSWLTHPVRMRSITQDGHHLIAAAEHRQMISMLSGTDNNALARLCVAHLEPSKRFYLSMYGGLTDRG
jgi:DNA-binding GntR family transcriptional regulator